MSSLWLEHGTRQCARLYLQVTCYTVHTLRRISMEIYFTYQRLVFPKVSNRNINWFLEGQIIVFHIYLLSWNLKDLKLSWRWLLNVDRYPMKPTQCLITTFIKNAIFDPQNNTLMSPSPKFCAGIRGKKCQIQMRRTINVAWRWAAGHVAPERNHN